MKQKLLAIGLVAVTMVTLLAMGCSSPTPTSAPAPAPATQKPTSAPAPAPSPAAKAIEWKFSVTGASRAITHPVEWYVKEMDSQSGGRLKITLFYNNALAPQDQQIDGLKAGSYQLAFIPCSDHPGKTPLSTGPELPFLIPAGDVQMGKLMWDYFHFAPLVDELSKWNAIEFYPLPLPQYQLISKKKVQKAEDFAGLRVRATKSQGDVLKEFGAVPTMIASPEMYDAMQKGTIDAAVLPAYTVDAYKLAEIGKFWITSLDLGTYSMQAWVNKDAWNALPADIKALHEKLVPGVIQRFTVYDEEANTYKWPNVEKLQFPAAEKAKLKAAADKVVVKAWLDDKKTRGLDGQAALDQINTLIKKYWQ